MRALPALGLTLALAACRPEAPPAARATRALRATPGGVDLTTFGVDNARTNWNRRETALTPEVVRPETFGRVASSRGHTDGDVQGQCLFASDLPVRDVAAGRDLRADTVFAATMSDRVYALDADDLHAFWRFDFEGRDHAWADELQRCQSHYAVGVMSTPALSPDRALLYVVGRVRASATDSWLQGYALRTRDGSIAARFRVGETVATGGARTPLAVTATDRGRPITVTFETRQYTQRAALLLVGNTLYVSTGGICDTPGFRGWMLGYDVTRLAESVGPRVVYVPTPGGGGGMWAVGGAASDGRSIYVPVGNGRAAMRAGTPEADRSIADALVRADLDLRVDPRACFAVGSPTAPCGPADAPNLRDVFMPRNAELLARSEIEDMDPDGDVGAPDEDFGSTGPLLVPAAALPANRGVDDDRPILAIAGKDGFVYLLDRARLGGIGPSPLRAPEDIARLVGGELWSAEVFQHSISGGLRANLAYAELPSGRYLFATGADEIGGRPDVPRGLAALRLTRGRDPSPAACAAQYRRTAYRDTSLGCATIWGAQERPAFELAWSGEGPLPGSTPFVSSNGNADAIVWVTQEVNRDDPEDRGVLMAFAADRGAAANRVFAPIYRSDRVAADAVVGHAAVFAGPVVANGRVYVPCSGGVVAYGVIPRRALPPPPAAPAPPACAADYAWESEGRAFMDRYCVSCHHEYQDLGFIRRRATRVAHSILPEGGDEPSMPLQRPGRPVALPGADERARVAQWIRCGAPARVTRVHAGYDDLAAPGGAFNGDAYVTDPARAGALSDDLLGAAALVNPWASAVPDAAFRVERAGPARWSIAVPGAGRYAVSLWFAEHRCRDGAASCRRPFDVLVQGAPAVRALDLFAAAGGPHRVVGRGHAVDLAAGARLAIEIPEGGRIHAIEVARVAGCATSADCPRLFACVGGACVPAPPAPPVLDAATPDDRPAVVDDRSTPNDLDAPLPTSDIAPVFPDDRTESNDLGPDARAMDADIDAVAPAILDAATDGDAGLAPAPADCGCRAVAHRRGGALALLFALALGRRRIRCRRDPGARCCRAAAPSDAQAPASASASA